MTGGSIATGDICSHQASAAAVSALRLDEQVTQCAATCVPGRFMVHLVPCLITVYCQLALLAYLPGAQCDEPARIVYAASLQMTESSAISLTCLPVLPAFTQCDEPGIFAGGHSSCAQPV
jgi:hypothetical protein